jgi:uncharacterized protein involved in exopolysaccharide biosynthesis
MIRASDVKALGTVDVSVTTPWPSVSQTLADRLLQGVNEFNLQTRKSQAGAERQFVDAQAADAEHELRDAEDQLQAFLQSNRAIGDSPQLTFERERLQRNVTLRQSIYTSLLQDREDARIREVRDTPVITVLDAPQLPLKSLGRKTLVKALAGALLGGTAAVAMALFMESLARARRKPSDEAQEFFALVEQAAPSFLRSENR